LETPRYFWNIVRKLKLVGEEGSIDLLHCLFYLSIGRAMASDDPFRSSAVALLTLCLTVIRDYFKPPKTNTELLSERLDSIESDLTALKMAQGIKNLR